MFSNVSAKKVPLLQFSLSIDQFINQFGVFTNDNELIKTLYGRVSFLTRSDLQRS